ncbi:MAG TPA: C40 family peptidase [Mycobacteriales bacterium]|nr:C40 family peptidase [Mycobacteriales bacterium]
MVLAVAATVSASVGTGTSIAGPTARHARVVTSVSRPARDVVAVSVAEVWAGRHKVKAVDRPAMQQPARLLTWLHRMTFYQRSHLFQRLATQVRYGEPVVALGSRGAYTRIRIPDQTGGRYPRGIIGWTASRQLAPEPAGWESAANVATVTARVAQLRVVGGTHARPLALSYATTLPVIRVDARRVVVAVAGPAQTGSLARRAVSIHAPAAPAMKPSRRQVIAQARRFLGLPYLWAGMSAWGFDCSGLTSTVYSMLGIRLPRDAADQSLVGRAVARRRLKPGDLVFFSYSRRRSGIHHVAIYAGHGRVLQSPYTGAHVELTRLRGSYLNREYWGATRLLS